MLIWFLILAVTLVLYQTVRMWGKAAFDFTFIVLNLYGVMRFTAMGHVPFAIISALAVVLSAVQLKTHFALARQMGRVEK